MASILFKCLKLLTLMSFCASLLSACNTTLSRNAELAVQDAERTATQQALARAAQEKEQQRALEEEETRREAAAIRVRQAAALEEQMRQEELELLAAATAERDRKLMRISELENRLNDIQIEVSNSETTISALQAAIAAAEELLEALTIEQAKYESIDESGFTSQPLAKELILELESRTDELVRQATPQ